MSQQHPESCESIMAMTNRLRLKRLLMLIALTSLGSTGILAGQQRQSGPMFGRVVDVVGATIRGASVYVRKTTSSDADVKLLAHTDINGDFTLELPDGGYDVLVTAPGFNASVKTMGIVHGKPNRFQWKLRPHDCSFPGMNCDTVQ